MNAETVFLQNLKDVRCWIPQPQKWCWVSPAGQLQGPALHWENDPGMAHLLWLSLNMDSPPVRYDARHNNLYCLLVTNAHKMKLCGRPITEWADGTTLSQFRRLCEPSTFSAPAPITNIANLIKALVNERLIHAHS